MSDIKFNIKDFGKVVVLYGGDSAEREISLNSGTQVLQTLQSIGVDAYGLDPQNYPKEALIQELQLGQYDLAFIVLHGGMGEDGTIQALLSYLNIPYTGSNIHGCSLAMDKIRAKLIFQALGIPTPKFVIVKNTTDAKLQFKANNFHYPVCIKPATEGSSLGVSKVSVESEIEQAFNLAVQYGGNVILEQWIDGDDLFVTVLDNQVLPPVLVKSNVEFYDYQAKYFSNKTEYTCPAKLTVEQEKLIKQMSLDAFLGLGCTSWGRLDLVIDKHGNPWMLEINTVPGMTDHSLVPMSAKAAGIGFADLLLSILSMALLKKNSHRTRTEVRELSEFLVNNV